MLVNCLAKPFPEFHFCIWNIREISFPLFSPHAFSSLILTFHWVAYFFPYENQYMSFCNKRGVLSFPASCTTMVIAVMAYMVSEYSLCSFFLLSIYGSLQTVHALSLFKTVLRRGRVFLSSPSYLEKQAQLNITLSV